MAKVSDVRNSIVKLYSGLIDGQLGSVNTDCKVLNSFVTSKAVERNDNLFQVLRWLQCSLPSQFSCNSSTLSISALLASSKLKSYMFGKHF